MIARFAVAAAAWALTWYLWRRHARLRDVLTARRLRAALAAGGEHLVQDLERDLGVSAARLHVLLARLEKDGVVASRWSEHGQGPRRRLYRLAPVRPRAGRIRRLDGSTTPVVFRPSPGNPDHFKAYDATGDAPAVMRAGETLTTDVIGPHQSVSINITERPSE